MDMKVYLIILVSTPNPILPHSTDVQWESLFRTWHQGWKLKRSNKKTVMAFLCKSENEKVWRFFLRSGPCFLLEFNLLISVSPQVFWPLKLFITSPALFLSLSNPKQFLRVIHCKDCKFSPNVDTSFFSLGNYECHCYPEFGVHGIGSALG